MVRIHKSEVQVLAEVTDLKGLSGHADANELMKWMSAVQNAPRTVFVTHGATDSHISPQYARALAAMVQANGGSVGTWIVDGAEHTRAITIVTSQYEHNLAAFFDAALVQPDDCVAVRHCEAPRRVTRSAPIIPRHFVLSPVEIVRFAGGFRHQPNDASAINREER